MARRKYEQGGGVVPTVWVAGSPSQGDEFGVVLMERWVTRWDYSGRVEVRAGVDAYRWDGTAKEWREVWYNDAPVGRCVRWMRVKHTVTAYPSLTLEDWPNAS